MTQAVNWSLQAELVYELHTVTPTVDGSSTIARSRGRYTTKYTWFEWCAPAYVKSLVEADHIAGYNTELNQPSKPREELDFFDGVLVSRKRASVI